MATSLASASGLGAWISSYSNTVRRFASATRPDCVIIGGGPGGYVCAIKAAQLGLKTTCIEKRGTLGGTCLNVGCIPSKALLNISHKFHDLQRLKTFGINVGSTSPTVDIAAMQKKKESIVKQLTGGVEFLFKKNQIQYVKGSACLKNQNEVEVRTVDGNLQTISTGNIVLATGSESSPFPGGAIQPDGKVILTSTEALNLGRIPKSIVIIGGGVIGLELGSVYKRLGSDVKVVEFLDKVAPALDEEMSKSLQKFLEKQGIKVYLQSKVVSATVSSQGAKIQFEHVKGGNKESLEAEVVLLSVGRRPYTTGLGLEKLGIPTDRGFIEVDDNYRTLSHKNIYAIGDAIKGAMLAHKAEAEGEFVAEVLSGHKPKPLNYNAIPNVVYTHPEVAGVGKTEQELKASGTSYRKATFPFAANSRAKANDDAEGSVKVLFNPTSRMVEGAWIFGDSAGELIHEFTIAIQNNLTVDDLAATCHAHPSLSEAVRESNIAASFGKAIHF